MGNRVLCGLLSVSLALAAFAGVLDFEALTPIEQNVGDEAGVQSVAVADLDGDGVPDLVVLDADEETVTAFLGVGDGTFHAGQLVGEVDLPNAVAVADLTSPFIGGGDVDGIPDVIVVDEIGGLQIFIGRGDGTFDPPDQSFDDLETVEISGVAVADFDGDDRDDLALLESFDGVYFLCNEAGTLQNCPTSVVLLDDFSFELVDIDVGDFDGGGLDVAAVDLDAGLLFVIHGNGDGTFEEVVEPIEIGEIGIEPLALRVAPLDSDENDDIALISFDSSSNPLESTLTIFSGAGPSTPFDRADFSIDGIASAFVLQDVDGDGASDAVVVGAEEFGEARYGAILRGNGTAFASPESAGLEPISGGRVLESGDFDGDGKIDLVAVVEEGSRIQVLLNHTAASAACAGDCDRNGAVAINELLRGVNIALGNAEVSSCTAVDRDGNGAVAINELIAAVNSALRGCGA